MIAKSLSSGTICLGCRLRLLRQVTRPNLAQSFNSSPALYRPRNQRWFSDTGSKEPEKSPDKDDWSLLEKSSEASEEQNRIHRALLREDDRSKLGEREENFRAWKHLDLRKRHISGKKILTETSESLGSDMLGEPAYAIVMRDTGSYSKRKRRVAPMREESEREKLDIQALLDSQLDAPTKEEVRDNINQLRPPGPEILLPEKEFRKIQYEMEEGFLKEQLNDYLEAFKPEKDEEYTIAQTSHSRKAEQDHFTSQFEWIRTIEPWVPAHEDRSNRPLHVYLPPDATPKERAVVRIMQECWGLQIEEVATGLGGMRITVYKNQFMPLMRGSHRFLRSISNMYLEEGEVIEAIAAAQEIRILAPRYKCQTIITEIDALIRKIQTHTFPLAYVHSDPAKFTDELLEEVGRATNTHVRLTETGNRLQVAWIQLSSHEKHEVESLSHVVFRFLRSTLQPDPATRTVDVTATRRAQSHDVVRHVVDHSNKEKWAWKDRLGCWARLVAPVSAPHPNIEATEAVGTEPADIKLRMDIEKPKSTQAQHLQVPVEQSPDFSSAAPQLQNLSVQEISRFPYQPVRWSSSLGTTTAAIFGHILSAHDEKTAFAGTFSEGVSLKNHNFSPVIPHPLSLAQLSLSGTKSHKNEVPITSTILVRFFHNPDSAARALPLVAPPLELRLSLSEPVSPSEDPEIMGVHSLRAITGTHHNDVLLPTNPVDLRITQTRSASLQGSASALPAWQPIADFLSRSRLDFGAGKLEMAETQRFQIPLWLFERVAMKKRKIRTKQRQVLALDHENDGSEEAGKAPEQVQGQEKEIEEEEEEAGPNALRSTLYDFAGLELHRSVAVPYPEDERFSLTYTSIEAGMGGGRRAELTLRPVPASDAIASRESAQTTAPNAENAKFEEDYVRACYTFAQTAKHWYGMPADVKGGSL
ncbi:hypothetical protein SUNI508_08756 [Seiridium unicorne]|uniref:Mitochondrial protein n=1 Tax=Seiridium unicorne TaxID=138068 RepID=A0ABR2USM1_9PEZI